MENKKTTRRTNGSGERIKKQESFIIKTRRGIYNFLDGLDNNKKAGSASQRGAATKSKTKAINPLFILAPGIILIITAIIFLFSGGKNDVSAANGEKLSLAPVSTDNITGLQFAGVTPPVNESEIILSAIVSKIEPATSSPMIITANVDGDEVFVNLQDRIAAAKAYSADTVGWMRVAGTSINMAVVQNTSNNIYYQDRGYDKKSSSYRGANNKRVGDYGVLWAAYNSKFGSRAELTFNTVIFGHNWDNIRNAPRAVAKTDILMEHIASYHHTDFANANPYINMSIDGEDLVWVVVAAYYTEDYWGKSGIDFDYFDVNLTESQKYTFVEEIAKRSQFTTDLSFTTEDQYLSLSTCTRVKGNTSTQRFVIVARLLREDEEEDLPKPVYTTNPAPKSPVL